MKIQSPPPAPIRPAMAKPVTEDWTVGKETFDSTAALLAEGDRLAGRPAVYLFTTQPDAAPFGPGERLANTAGYALSGALAGTVGGGVVGGCLVILGGMASIANALMGLRGSSLPTALVAVPAAVGAVIGAGYGAVQGWAADGRAAAGQVSGVLQKDGEHLAFYPQGQVSAKVDLVEYRDAPPAPLAPPKPPSSGEARVMGAVAGLGCGLPLIGLLAGPATGARVGRAIDQRTALGEGAGMVLGLGLPALSLAAASRFHMAGLLATEAAFTTAGALLGPTVLRNSAGGPTSQGQYEWWSIHQDRPPQPED